MSDRYERLNRHIDRLLADHRGDAGATEDEEEREVLAMAARLRLLRPGVAVPRRRYVARLRARLADAINPRPRFSRRPLLVGGAGGLLAGALGGLALALGRGPADLTAAVGGDTARLGGWVAAGNWRAVPDGGALAFSTATLSGYLLRSGASITALSNVCNHRGCRVDWQAAEREFVCACDGAAFDRGGQYVEAPYEASPTTIPPLTPLAVRIIGDAVYVRRA